ncbi:serine hydrolase domain-containing protein [Streptomyces naphthomycinicus]|uniref:serine hydrolase domain-containing protein n=1 Tax=Streptomyces naphthomycinicus TaxID=2872625 RepID=UPI001CEC04F1|nr:serine hydrolase domain-containing protein [Streptomyces sp. TML10]
MPTLRTVLSIPVCLALLLAPAASQDTSPVAATDTVLPLFVTDGRAPAAALPARDTEGDGVRLRYATAGRGIRRADHFRAGSITKTFIATVVLQLAAEHRLTLSDTVERHLPGLLRGRGTDGRHITLRALLTHTSGLADFTETTRGLVPLTAPQAVRIALSLPPARPGRYSYSSTNYVLLGLVVRQVTGRSPAAEAERRIIAPLGLTGSAATADGRRVLTFRANTDEIADSRLEPALLAAEFCPRTP